MKIFIIIIVAVAVLILFIVLCTGFYVIPQYDLATSCDTCERPGDDYGKPGVLWFWRPGSGAGFITSDGGMLIELKEKGIAFFDRINITAEAREEIKSRGFITLPYTEFMYRLSADGRKPVKYDDAF